MPTHGKIFGKNRKAAPLNQNRSHIPAPHSTPVKSAHTSFTPLDVTRVVNPNGVITSLLFFAAASQMMRLT